MVLIMFCTVFAPCALLAVERCYILQILLIDWIYCQTPGRWWSSMGHTPIFPLSFKQLSLVISPPLVTFLGGYQKTSLNARRTTCSTPNRKSNSATVIKTCRWRWKSCVWFSEAPLRRPHGASHVCHRNARSDPFNRWTLCGTHSPAPPADCPATL